MIKYLFLKNFVLFEEEKIEFKNNINALVGDTGAGKSVIFSAINVLCGQRNIKKYIMKNKEYYELEILIDLKSISKKNFLKIADKINLDDKLELKVYRKLTIDSKSLIKVNNKEMSLNDLKDIMSYLVEIHFQNSTDDLLKAENQINIIDDLLDIDLLLRYKEEYKIYVEQKSKLKKMIQEDQNKEATLEMIDFQIQKLKLIEGVQSEEELEKQKKEFENVDKIKQVDNSIENSINIIYKELGELKNVVDNSLDLGYAQYKEIVDNSYYEIENLSFEHSKKSKVTTLDNIDDVIDKLSLIRSLKRKYNLDYEGLINKYESLLQKKEELENLSFLIIKEEKVLKQIEEEVKKIAQKLSKERKVIGKSIQEKIVENFKDLDMPNADLDIKISEVDIGENGIDEVEFLLRTNKGHDMQNIISIASGGEKSRIMLIFKIVMNSFKNKNIFLLDEIDQGVSAQVAKNLGVKLGEFAKDIQVIIISHTVQVISMADYLYEVKKDDDKLISISHVKVLEEDQKQKFINKYLEI